MKLTNKNRKKVQAQIVASFASAENLFTPPQTFGPLPKRKPFGVEEYDRLIANVKNGPKFQVCMAQAAYAFNKAIWPTT
jgi:hypothetical protein